MGGGGNFISNESMYRANRIRIGAGATDTVGGHLHLPQVGTPEDPLAITGPAFEKRRKVGSDQTIALIKVAAS